MGKFVYDQIVKVDLDDRVLAHLVVVIGAKLRRGESFHFSWREDLSVGGGRTTVWMHPGVPLVYKFSGSRRPSLNRAWVDALAMTANTPGGLYVVPEPAEHDAMDDDAAGALP
ncbi:MAG TPA: ATP-dependent DNA ligase [Microbacterium sp.]|nr:ATP-dependent DNA ligase [Microbacterium sp.]